MSTFRIIRAEERAASMIEWFSGICTAITDFIAGSKIRSQFESVAVEMEAQDFAFYQAMKKAIPVSVYNAFGFTLTPAIKASGTITFTGPTPVSNITIPKGTRVTTLASGSIAAKEYETQADIILYAGQTSASGSATCTVFGIIGNTAAATITVLSTPITGITAATNAAAFQNGADIETEEARRTRFQDYITTITRGIAGAVTAGAKTATLKDANGNITERVTTAGVTEPYLTNALADPGHIYCYIYNGTGGTSNDLIAQAQKVIDGYIDNNGTYMPGYKAAGVICTVYAAVEDVTAVTVTITAATSLTTTEKTQLQADAVTAINNHIAGLGMGQGLLRSKIIDILMSKTGVYNVGVTVPALDVPATLNHVIKAGTVTVMVV